MSSKGAIVGIGEILFDLLPQGAQLGGAPANFAYHVSCLGGEGVAVSAIGKDKLGEEVKSILSSKKLSAVLPEIDCPTGIVEVTLDSKGVPSYNIIQGVAWDNVPYTEEMKSLAKRTSAVCFGSLAQRSEVTGATVMSFIVDMPQDSLKVFDINLRQHYYSKEIVSASLEISDILKINDEEIAVISELMSLDSDPVKACRELISAYKLRFVILTKGGNGSDVITSDEYMTIASPEVEIADTVGAGDAFTAAFVYSYLNGKPLGECHRLANEISAFVCTKNGAMPEYDDSIKI